jgi:hypothetical protein
MMYTKDDAGVGVTMPSTKQGLQQTNTSTPRKGTRGGVAQQPQAQRGVMHDVGAAAARGKTLRARRRRSTQKKSGRASQLVVVESSLHRDLP